MGKKTAIKILSLVLLVSLISTLVMGISAIITVSNVTPAASSKDSGDSQKRVDEIKTSIEQDSLKYQKDINALLENITQKTKDTAKKINNVYANPQYFETTGNKITPPVLGGTGYKAQVIYETDVDTQSLTKDVDLAANAAPYLLETAKSDGNIISAFLSLESKFTVFADNNQKGKFNSKGGVIQYNARDAKWYKEIKTTLDTAYTGIGYDKYGKNPYVISAYPVTGGGFKGGVCVKYALSSFLSTIGKDGYTTIVFDSEGNITYSDAKDDSPLAKGKVLEAEEGDILNQNSEKAFETTVSGSDVFASVTKTISPDINIAVIKPALEIPGIQKGGILGNSNQKAVYTLSIILVLLIVLVIVFSVRGSFKAAKMLTSPIKRITNGIECVGEGNFEYSVTPEGTDETIALSNSFNKLGPKLSKLFEDSKSEVYDYEKKNGEFNISTRVQRDSNLIDFPESDYFEIFASVKPAKYVCSDFFDVFETDSNHIAFCMIDSNEKNIDGTILGKIIKELIKAHAVSGQSPYEVLTNVNAQVSLMNEKKINASVFMGVLEINTGKLVYVNAGFKVPLIKSNGEFTELAGGQNPRFMINPEVIYKQESILLKKGDELYLFSDGITDSVNDNCERFDNSMVIKGLKEYASKPINQILKLLHDDVRMFVKGAPQADDISLLILKIK